ncbi:MAG: MarR family transcriptional regulator [Armatimonadetes bacterium]|nr:MarR family transcriptional regulator [Armatimonadota bacterium]
MKEPTSTAAQVEILLPRIMRRLFALDPAHDLPLAQLRVCTILQSGPQTVSWLSEELGISVSAVTQLTDRLEKAELVRRAPEPSDRRCKRLRLTTKGANLMQSRRADRLRRVERALRRMPARKQEQLLDGLHALLEATGVAQTPTTSAAHNIPDRIAP